MSIHMDDTENAIHSIRRVSRITDLDQIEAVLRAKRSELINRPFPQRRGLALDRVHKENVGKPVVRRDIPPRRLDPSYKKDPAFLDYQAAETALQEYCRRHKVNRTAADPAVRQPFETALEHWRSVKGKYKLSQPGQDARYAHLGSANSQLAAPSTDTGLSGAADPKQGNT